MLSDKPTQLFALLRSVPYGISLSFIVICNGRIRQTSWVDLFVKDGNGFFRLTRHHPATALPITPVHANDKNYI